MAMHNPPHPGEVLRDGVLCVFVSLDELARRLGMSDATRSRLVNGQGLVTADMARRLEAALGVSAES